MYLTSKRPFHYKHSLHGAPNKLQTLLQKKTLAVTCKGHDIQYCYIKWRETHTLYIHTHTHMYMYLIYLYIYNSSWFKSIMKFQHPGISFLVHLQNLFSHLQVFQGYLKQRMRISNFEMVKYYIQTWPTVNIHNSLWDVYLYYKHTSCYYYPTAFFSYQ